MASGAFAQGLSDFAAGSIDWDADTIKGLLAQAGYTLNKETQSHLDDVASNRYNGTTDQTLGSKTNTIDTVNNRVELSGGSLTFPSVTIDGSDDAIGIIVYKDTGVASTSPLIVFDDSSDATPDGNNIVYTPNAEGILQLDYGA